MRDIALVRRLTAAALVASFLLPAGLVRGGPVVCTFRAVTGLPCPSCGMTRSWSAMGHGRLREATGYHLLGPATFVAAMAMVAVGDERAASAIKAGGRNRALLGGMAAAFGLAWAWRLMRGWHD